MMHIDWFIVVSSMITFVIAGYALWLNGKGDDKKRRDDHEKSEKPAGH